MDELIKVIVENYGPLGILIALILTGFLVPKAYYTREIARGDKATEATATTSESLRQNAEGMKLIATEMGSMKNELKGLRDDLRQLKSAGG